MNKYIVFLFLMWAALTEGKWHTQDTQEFYIQTNRTCTNYSAAVSACTSMNATLARIKTKQVQDFRSHILTSESIQQTNLAVNCNNSNSTSNLSEGGIFYINHTLWGEIISNNTAGNCVQIKWNSTNTWTAMNCTEAEGYICERPAERTSMEQTTQTPEDETDSETPEVSTESGFSTWGQQTEGFNLKRLRNTYSRDKHQISNNLCFCVQCLLHTTMRWRCSVCNLQNLFAASFFKENIKNKN
uniref:uncharacterized protein LOC100181844 isoform X2 n=1 Tax=Ciona intestinalis TaxID=7719 RepID=UPI0005215320|nr:uncharacterized protein LOC100181844 isoform X2 [Ciona intestinalis]|eukprot:XP_026695777.1 uncharacterized protein LOC100181844 isoform X2 [Ciona intestinalis]